MASTLSMPVYPALLIAQTFGFNDWQSGTLWYSASLNLKKALSLRNYDDPRVGLDLESYKQGATAEPEEHLMTEEMISAVKHHMRASGFLQILSSSDAVVQMYPFSPHNVVMSEIINTIGENRCEAWYELSFDIEEQRRLRPLTTYRSTVLNMQSKEELARSLYPNIKIRHVADEGLFKTNGIDMRNDIRVLGRLGPWIFDGTRNDKTYRGDPGWVSGTTSHSANRVKHVWACAPLWTSNVTGTIGGVNLVTHRITSTTTAAAPIPSQSLDGLLLKHPQAPTHHIVLRGDLFTSATKFGTCFEVILPMSFTSSVGLGGIWTNGQYNTEISTLAYEVENDRIVQYVRNPSGGAITTIEVLTSPAKDTPIKIALGQSGSWWFHMLQSYGAPKWTSLGFTPAGCRMSIYGQGILTSSGGTSYGYDGIRFVNQIIAHDDPFTDSEMYMMMSGSYPYKRGT